MRMDDMHGGGPARHAQIVMGPSRRSFWPCRPRSQLAPSLRRLDRWIGAWWRYHRGVPANATPSESLIHARGLTKRFGSFTAVDGVDFDVAPGEAFGFLGPNGAGKTSTMRDDRDGLAGKRRDAHGFSALIPLTTARGFGRGWALFRRRIRSTTS